MLTPERKANSRCFGSPGVSGSIVMYTLTGNYKADQVHAPALIERLGQ